jgi:hypothetical protein
MVTSLLHVAEQEPAKVVGVLSQLVRSGCQVGGGARLCNACTSSSRALWPLDSGGCDGLTDGR